LTSKNAVELAARDTPESKSLPSRVTVKVAEEVDVFVTAMLVTTVVVDDGTVYRVVEDVAAAVLARATVVVAISYYLSLIIL
jgi:hypothetical protein